MRLSELASGIFEGILDDLVKEEDQWKEVTDLNFCFCYYLF